MTVPSTWLVKDIYTAGVNLLMNNWNKEPIRLLGISLSGFGNDYEHEQISLFQLPKMSNEKSDSDKIESLENTIHIMRQKYGSSIIKPGVLIKKENKN